MKIYFDTEFSDLWDPQPISLGFVAEDGKECYIELEHDEKRNSAFVKEYVEPALEGPELNFREAAEKIEAFLEYYAPLDKEDSKRVQIVCDFVGDWWILREVFPDVILWADPIYTHKRPHPNLWILNRLHQHHALHDARMLKLACEEEAA